MHRFGLLRKLVREALYQIRAFPARLWIQERLRIQPARAKVWFDRINGKRKLQAFDPERLLARSHAGIGAAAGMPSLQAHGAPWRLPVWPKQRHVRRQLIRAWKDWTCSHRLHPRVRRSLASHLYGGFARQCVPPCPPAWHAQECEFAHILSSSDAFLPDDRDSQKVWSVAVDELFAHLVNAINVDPMWTMAPDFRRKYVLAWGYARAYACLPSWLLGRAAPRSQGTAPPEIFAFVKSKCFSDEGIRTCTKAGHSCLRRLVDASQVPFARAWRAVARGVRAVVQVVGLSCEVFSMADAIPSIKGGLAQLEASPTGCCARCSQPVVGLSIFSADVDQAFEACAADRVLPAWMHAATRYQEQTGSTSIFVQKSKAFAFRIPRDHAWSRGWWAFSLTLLGSCLHAATVLSFACLSTLVIKQHGLAIGGILSSAAVSVVLGYEEALVLEGSRQIPGFPMSGKEAVLRRIFWCRYVDDLLAFSFCYCPSCIGAFASQVYAEKLSVVHASDGARGLRVFEWLDIEFHFWHSAFSWTLKNPNRGWVLTDSPRQKSNLLPWMGRPPTSFKRLRSMLIGRLVRAATLEVPLALRSFIVFEFLLELLRLSYPLSFVKALIHSTPPSAAVVLARRSIRSLQHSVRSIGPF